MCVIHVRGCQLADWTPVSAHAIASAPSPRCTYGLASTYSESSTLTKSKVAARPNSSSVPRNSTAQTAAGRCASASSRSVTSCSACAPSGGGVDGGRSCGALLDMASPVRTALSAGVRARCAPSSGAAHAPTTHRW